MVPENVGQVVWSIASGNDINVVHKITVNTTVDQCHSTSALSSLRVIVQISVMYVTTKAETIFILSTIFVLST